MPFDDAFVRTLERLYLLARRRLTQSRPGERTSDRRGGSIEFADYRAYVPGDEIRYIDWNVYARHGTLFVKEFSAEESVHVVLMLDASNSMSFGTPSKLLAAREIAAALGYIGLVSFDSVSLYSFAESAGKRLAFLRGKNRVLDLLASLDGVQPGGRTRMADCLAAPLPELKGRTLVILLSDFYDPSYPETLRRLRSHRHQLLALHMVSKEEREPSFEGPHVFIDLEDGHRREMDVTPTLLDRYQRRFSAHCDEVERFCIGNEIRYVRVPSEISLEERLMEILRQGGVLELR